MSLFDFPRINFNGNVDVNVPTINNTVYFPLAIYDAVRSLPLTPPRVYFSTYEKAAAVESTLEPKPTINQDPYNNYFYIEVASINDIKILRNWCMTPIYDDPVKNKFDYDYIPYYKAAEADLGANGYAIIGNAPGYWNMFGDMGVKFYDTAVTGVQTGDTKNGVRTWLASDKDVPSDISRFFGAEFDTNTEPGNVDTYTSLMVETISNQSVYANIFCNQVNLSVGGQNVLFSGQPYRFSAQIYNAWRVLNWLPPMAGSARFVSSVPISKVKDAENSEVIQFFKNNQTDPSKELKGVFVTFTIQEVFENRYDQEWYVKYGEVEKPAQCATVGSITPWYDGDMKAGTLGRNLVSQDQATVADKGQLLAPAIASTQMMGEDMIFSVDLGNTIPEQIIPAFDSNKPPIFRNQASFETYDLGKLSFRTSADASTEFAQVLANPTDNPLTKVHAHGAVYDFIISDKAVQTAILNNDIQVYLEGKDDTKRVLLESTYMFTSDQKGMYTEQGDNPSDGYRSFSYLKEPCVIRIAKRGELVQHPVSVGIVQYDAPEAGNDPQGGYQKLTWKQYKDGDVVDLTNDGLQLDDNAIFYFVYENQYPNNQIPVFVDPNTSYYYIMDTGAFVCLRVHQAEDFSQYTDPKNWSETPPTYEVVYENVFKLYDVVYPAMAKVHPFTKDEWNNSPMADRTLEYTDIRNWHNSQYMPRSRELGKDRHALIKAWARYLKSKGQ